MQIWRAVEFQAEVGLSSNDKIVFMYLEVGVKVGFPLKQEFSPSPRGGIVVDRIPKLSCGVCIMGVLEMSISGFSPGGDLGNKSHVRQVLGKLMFKTLRGTYTIFIQSHFFSEEVTS